MRPGNCGPIGAGYPPFHYCNNFFRYGVGFQREILSQCEATGGKHFDHAVFWKQV